MSGAYLPPGWPDGVRPPGSEGWLPTAVAFLLDCCPPDFRGYPELRRHPAVLARFADRFVAAQAEAATTGLAEIRTALRDLVRSGEITEPVVDRAADAWQEQQAQLVRTRRAVGLVEQAIRGEVFVRRL
ncbi:hypothetical protein FHX74_002505 [Friedmanniella endophytica]|uniref:Uncharacterized protein n=1 Tax=Microlunatus kandeliicorticis TaxID=1759536 RepID=A0A7W3P6E8_9ACTN|nr:hypothetical protein [Microlunatus kandeliicorticis]MBA8794877.1 hypothetical protein [Microlunatus kandeliicorticis]